VPASTFSTFATQPPQEIPPASQPSMDTQSVRSATTTGSQGGINHPDLHEPGLNSSIVETINVRFENGKVVNTSIGGEVALAYNPVESSSAETEKIRLENFSRLMKIAGNPAFVSKSESTEGEYLINLSSLSRTKSQVAFKYQVSAEGNAHLPIILAPALRIEPSQLSAIVQYTPNPDFTGTATFSKLTLAFSFEGAKAISALTKPNGVLLREKNLVYWHFDNHTITPGSAAEKLLARFATDGQASGGLVEAKWEISSDHAQSSGSALSVSSLSQGAPDPFADADGAWKPVPGVRRITSGSYVAR
jgi:F-BAR domain only protein